MANKTTYELALEIGGKIQSSLEKSVGGVNKKLDSIGKAAKTAAKIATAAFAAVKVGDFIKDAVSTYADFDQAMANTAATAGASAEEYQKLEEAALEMGKKTTKTATEASEALGYMALAGWDVETSISALEPVLRLSEATSMDLATCSDLVTDSMSALGLTVDELSGYLDVACKANNKSNQTAQQLMEAYIGCGGVLNNLGVSVEDSATALGVLANRGIKGSEAGNKLNTVLINLTSGTGQAGKMMEKLGISAFDSEGKFIGLQETLQLVNDATKDLSEEERNAALAAIGGKTQIDTLNDLLAGLNTTTEDGRTEWAALNDELNNAQGAMMDMAGKVTDTLPGAMAVFGSAVDDAKIRLVKVFAPMAKDAIFAIADYIPHITEKVTGFIQTLQDKAVPAISSFKDKAVAFFGRVRPVLEDIRNKGVAAFQFLANVGKTAFENIKAKIEENKPAIDKVIAVALDLKDKFFEAFEKAKPVISYIATTALPAVVGAIMKVVGAAATVYQKLNEWGALKPIIMGVAGAIAAMKIAGFVKDAINAAKAVKALVTVFIAQKQAMIANIALKAKDLAETAAIHALYIKDAVVKAASTAATWAQTAAMTAWNAICTVGTAVTTALGAAFTFLTSPIGLVILAIAGIITICVILYKNWDKVKEKASQLGEWIAGVFENLKNKVVNAIQAFADKFPAAFAFISSVFESWKQTVTGVIDGVKQVFQGIIQFFTGVFTGDWQKALDGLKNIFSGAFKALSSLALAPLNALKGVVTGAFNAIDTATGGKLTAIKEKASAAWTSIKDNAGKVLSAAKDTISEKLSNIKSAYEEHGGGIKGVAAAAIEGVKGYYTAGYSFINNLTGGKLEEVRAKFSEKLSAVGTNVSNAFNNVKSTMGTLMSQAASNVTSNLENMKAAYNSAGGGIRGIVSGAMAGVKGTFSNTMSAINTLTGGKLESIRSAFTSKLDAAKQAATSKFEEIKSGISSKLDAAKQTVQNGLNAIKGFFSGLHLELPKIKMPHFSVSGDFSIAPPKVPKISVEWYKEGGILTGPTIFGANGGSLLGGGEAGKEAVLPLSELWSNMKSVVSGIVGNQPEGSGAAELFGKIKDLVGGGQPQDQEGGSVTKELYNTINNNNTVNKTNETNSSDDSQKIVYSPQITIQGNASKEDVESALKMSQAEFNQMMAEYSRQKGRTSFAPA